MAILLSIFTNLQQFVSKYVLTSQDSQLFGITIGIYTMPIVYFIILGGVALIAYFGWQSYRQDVDEEKLQKEMVTKDESYSTFNLAWINQLINWVYMKSPAGLPEAVQRWIEDVNLNLAKSQHPIKILLYDVQEKSMPPWIGNIGKVEKRAEHIEIPVFLHGDEDDLVFTVSIQEENDGKLIASTYNIVVTHFQCWFTLYISMVEGKGFLAKLVAKPQSVNDFKFRLDLLSDQKISTTVPEVVLDIITKNIVSTPFYLNLSNWGSVIQPLSKKKTSQNQLKKEAGLSTTPPSDKTTSREEPKVESVRRRQKDKKSQDQLDDDTSIRKSNTMPSGTSNIISERMKVDGTHGLSGSLGSLVGIKRIPSGRGPAKPIRSREIRIVMKVIETSGLPNKGSVFCRGILDRPQQKCETQPTKPGSSPAWPNDELTFDLSSRSSEVKLVFYQGGDTENNEGSAIASTILYLEKIGTDRSTFIVLPLRTVNKESAQIKLQLDFTENPVDPTSQKFSSPRRSLDLSYMSEQVLEKENMRSISVISSPSSYSSENMSTVSKNGTPTTIVKTVTTKKLTKSSTKMTTNSNANRSAVKSDTATVEGSVVETVVKDLSDKSELANRSPDRSTKIRKAKTNLNDGTFEDVTVRSDDEKIVHGSVERMGSFHSVKDEKQKQSEAISQPVDENPADGQGSQDKVDPSEQSSKSRRKRHQRPKSLASGIKASERPRKSSEEREWPRIRRSRSLIFGRGKKKPIKTGSATDLDKRLNSKEESGFDDESIVTVPENDLQKHNKKKKSRSISKLISKLGRRPSQRKSKVQSDSVNEEEDTPSISDSVSSPTSISASPFPASPDSAGRQPSYTGSENSTPSSLAPDSNSHNSSTLESGGLKRSKSLRKRLFGGKRKTNKN